MRRRTAGSDPPQAARGKLPGNAIRDARNVGYEDYLRQILRLTVLSRSALLPNAAARSKRAGHKRNCSLYVPRSEA